MTESDGTREDEFLIRVRRASRSVLGDSDSGREIRSLCDEHHRARQLISQDRAAGALVVGVVGAIGQGKSWLIRQLIRRSPAASSIRSGNNLDQSTEQLVWIGPSPPADLDPRFEQYVRVSSDEMEPLGVPYLLVDAPGATDGRNAIADVAKRALSLASAIVMVVRRDQIRGETPGNLAMASEGTILLPVINAVGTDRENLQGDVDAFIANLRATAPESIISKPILVDDFEITEATDEEIGERAARELIQRLKVELENNPDSDRRKSARLAALDERFRAALSASLADRLPGLTRAVSRLNEEAMKLPGEVAQTLVGSDGPMQAAVRSRLRLQLLTSTGAIWFPYRTILSVLNLTHGAWDRVLLSLSGSLPSLVSTIWTSTRSLTADHSANEEVRSGLQRRSAAAVTDRLGPLAAQFRDELENLSEPGRSAGERLRSSDGNPDVASMAGIEALQERSHEIFEDSIASQGISRNTSRLLALLGTLIFWALMAGPFVALYSEYLAASYDSLVQVSNGGEAAVGHALEQFPRPEFSLVLTSVALSLLPTALFAMIALSLSQSAGRTERAMAEIRKGHADAIERLQLDGVLRLRWDDPLLSDAEFLVSAGRR